MNKIIINRGVNYMETIVERKGHMSEKHILEQLIEKAISEHKYIYFGEFSKIKEISNRIKSDDKELFIIENSNTGVVIYSK